MITIKDLSLDDTQTQILEACTGLKKDRISDLPDDILVHILSLLTLKEAGGSSLLSKRWRNVWADVRCLNFYPCYDSLKELYRRKASLSEKRQKQIAEERKYVRWVDQVVSSHKADTIDEFSVRFDLEENRKENIDNWLRFAMAKRVKRLECNLRPRGLSNIITYNLPSLSSPGVPLLTSLQLMFVEVTGEHLERLLHDYPTLEVLLVEFAKTSLVNLKVAGPAARNLKSLKIRGCFEMKHLEISAPNLITFDYLGPILPSFPLISTPKLSELSVHGDYGNHLLNNFMRFASIFSQIEVLSLSSFTSLEGGFSKEYPVGARLQMLEIDINIKTEEELFVLCSMIHACPLLHKFVLKRHSWGEILTRTFKEKEQIRHPHHHLKIVEMTGCHGGRAEFRFAEYLIRNAVSLEKIIIKVATEFEEHVREAMRIRTAKRLRPNLKPGVHLEIL